MEKFTKIIEKFSRDFKKLGKKEKTIISVILAAVFLFGLLGSIFYQKLSYKKYRKVEITPSPTAVPEPAKVSLLIGSDEAKVGATFSAAILINSPNQGVDAADFVVNFDPNYLSVATISSGTFFRVYPRKSIDKNFVTISGMASFKNNTFTIPKGKGTVADITFKAISATDSTSINFDRGKTIVASKGKNILENINDAVITLR